MRVWKARAAASASGAFIYSQRHNYAGTHGNPQELPLRPTVRSTLNSSAVSFRSHRPQKVPMHYLRWNGKFRRGGNSSHNHEEATPHILSSYLIPALASRFTWEGRGRGVVRACNVPVGVSDKMTSECRSNIVCLLVVRSCMDATDRPLSGVIFCCRLVSQYCCARIDRAG